EAEAAADEAAAPEEPKAEAAEAEAAEAEAAADEAAESAHDGDEAAKDAVSYPTAELTGSTPTRWRSRLKRLNPRSRR
ncbi:MAG: hypothetical protein QOG75_4343, partial [Mycobacterium sp.]|nr:hypothetical protein [Mycobacterium sp.]